MSAFRDVVVVARGDTVAGAKAEADPARIAALKAINFMVIYKRFSERWRQ